jgi:glucosamine kinase
MILIVESGSTKADWLIIDSSGIQLSFKTKGWNLLLLHEVEIKNRLDSLSQLKPFINKVKEVYFYTPGVALVSSAECLKNRFESKFNQAIVHVESDLLAAARSVFKGTPQFVSILGTGSNTAFYDGQELLQTTPSLGYILGDEGSGSCLGKQLLKAYLYKTLPNDLHLSFSKSFAISKEKVLESTYIHPNSNRFFSSYVPFLVAHKSHPFIQSLVCTEFETYIKVHLLSNKLIHDYSVAFVGSVAFLFQNMLRTLCAKHKIEIELFCQYPLNGLHYYHLS